MHQNPSTPHNLDVVMTVATEDGDAVAVSLGQALHDRGLRVHYASPMSFHESEDRRTSPDSVLVVLISPAFLSDARSLRELKSILASRQETCRVVVPVLHGIDPAEVSAHSLEPALGDCRHWISTDEGVERAASRIEIQARRVASSNANFYWEWFRHEETIFTYRASFFLVAEAMLFTGYAQLRTASPELLQPIHIFEFLGAVIAGVWLLASSLHFWRTRSPLEHKVNHWEPRRKEISGPGPWEWLSKTSLWMGIVIPGVVCAWWWILWFAP